MSRITFYILVVVSVAFVAHTLYWTRDYVHVGVISPTPNQRELIGAPATSVSMQLSGLCLYIAAVVVLVAFEFVKREEEPKDTRSKSDATDPEANR